MEVTHFNNLKLSKNELAHLTTHEANLSCNKLGCCRLRKVFAKNSVNVACFTGPGQTLVMQQVIKKQYLFITN